MNFDMGFYGCDSYEPLLIEVINQTKENNPDVIVVNGDLIGHGYAANETDNQTQIETKWNNAKTIINGSLNLIREAHPGKKILPTIGNNDV